MASAAKMVNLAILAVWAVWAVAASAARTARKGYFSGQKRPNPAGPSGTTARTILRPRTYYPTSPITIARPRGFLSPWPGILAADPPLAGGKAPPAGWRRGRSASMKSGATKAQLRTWTLENGVHDRIRAPDCGKGDWLRTGPPVRCLSPSSGPAACRRRGTTASLRLARGRGNGDRLRRGERHAASEPVPVSPASAVAVVDLRACLILTYLHSVYTIRI
jgi:hypothetical protein